MKALTYRRTYLIIIIIVTITSSLCLNYPISNYTNMGSFNSIETPFSIKYSPDSAGILWTTRNDDKVFYFLSLQNLLDQKPPQLITTNDGWDEYCIDMMAFSPIQNRLLLVAQSGDQKQYFLWFFTDNGVISQEFLSFEMSDFSSNMINSVHVSPNFQVAVTAKNRIGIFNIKGDLVNDTTIQNIQSLSIKWHPLNPDLMLIGGVSQKPSEISGRFSFYDLKEKKTFIINQYQTKGVAIVEDGSMIFQLSQQRGVEVYKVFQNLITQQIGQLNVGDEYYGMEISADGSLLFLYKQTNKYQFQAYKLIKSSGRLKIQKSQQSEFKAKSQNEKNGLSQGLQQMQFQQIVQLPNGVPFRIPVSTDGQQFVYQDDSNNTLSLARFALCKDGDYLTNLTCLKCSEKCRTCSKNSSTCTTCQTVNNTIVLYRSSCVNCSQPLVGCLTCSDFSHCTQCDVLNNFQLFNSKCYCKNFYYNNNGTCTQCDPYQKCKRCQSVSLCYDCNTDHNWTGPVNGTCVCADFYYDNNNTCQLCDNKQKCLKCKSPSECLTCNTKQYWSQTAIRGECVCQQNFLPFNDTCVLCPILGCSYCKNPGDCEVCLDGYVKQGDDCVCQDNYKRDPNTNICIAIEDGVSKWWFVLIGVGLVGIMIFGCKCCKKGSEFRRERMMREEQVRRRVDSERIIGIQSLLYQQVQRQREVEYAQDAPVGSVIQDGVNQSLLSN